MFERLKRLIPDLDKAKVIEAIIDPAVHLEYLEYSSKYRKNIDDDDIISEADKIFDKNVDIEEKKRLLVTLAKIDDVAVFRKLEKYAANPDEELKDWAVIAMQESLNLIRSSLLEEEHILISTGLGGKGNNLRFFIILQTENHKILTEKEKEIIRKEVTYAFEENKCELEQLEFGDFFFTIVGLFPFLTDALEITLNTIINEVAQFGIKLSDNYVLTNVKISSIEESRKILSDMEERYRNIQPDDFGNDIEIDFFDEDSFDDFDDGFDDFDDFDDDDNDENDDLDDDEDPF